MLPKRYRMCYDQRDRPKHTDSLEPECEHSAAVVFPLAGLLRYRNPFFHTSPPHKADRAIEIPRDSAPTKYTHLPEFVKQLKNIVVVNPEAGAGTMAPRTQSWKSLLTPQHQVLIGKDAQHTERLAAQAASDHVSSLTIVGGDGTLHHALNGYLSVPHTTTKLCIIPGGTANDYAASLNAHAFSTGNRELTVDIGILSYPNFQRFFLNVAGIGLTAHTAISSRPARWLPARLRYTRGLLRTLISGWRYMDTWIEMQDQRIRQQHLLTLSVAIGTREGSFLLAPDARLDDGYFNLLLVSDLKRHDVVRYLPGLLLGKLPQRDPRIQYLVAKGLKLISSSPLNVHLDGEIYGTGTIPADCEVTIDHARQIEVELLTADG